MAMVPLLVLACGARTGLSRSEPDASVPGPDGAPADPERCNGEDDDGDGLVDEDVPPVSCGVGACARVVACEDGAFADCVPGDPAAEACNGADDDCDGTADDGLGFGPIGDPILVRDTEGTTGDCSSCRWAFGPALWIHDGGMVAFWRLGFDGMSPRPNAFFRTLDANAAPSGEVSELFGGNVTGGFLVAPVADDRALLAHCLRDRADDLHATTSVGSDGSVGESRWHFDRDFCSNYATALAWTGRRALLASTDEDALRIETADGRGRTLDARTLGAGRTASAPSIARGHGRLAVASAVFTEDFSTIASVHLLDETGEILGDPVELGQASAPDGRWRDLLVGATAEGWLLTAASDLEPGHGGRIVARLAPDGAVIEEATLIDDDASYGNWTIGARPGGGAVLAGNRQSDDSFGPFVMTLRPDGRRDALWLGPEDDGRFVTLASSSSRMFTLWADLAANFEPNQVWIQELGCTP
jgi:hypothetical protein